MKAATYSLSFISIALATIAILSAAKAPADPAAGAAKASTPASRPAVTVRIDNFVFQPRELVIAVGTTVTWQNADDVPHTATSKDDPQVFDSGPLDTDDKFSFTFSKPGKYTYFCKVHPHMTGVVTVN